MKKRIIFVLTAAMLFFSQVMISSCGDEEEDEPVSNNSDKNNETNNNGTNDNKANDNGTNSNQQTVKEKTECTVSYSSDFGVAPQSLTVKEGDELTSGDLKPLDTDGYIFLGWYNGSKQVEEGFVVKQDLKLVAKWEAKQFLVTFSTQFGTVPNDISVKQGESLSSNALKELSYSGYEFLGWYDGDKKIERDFVVEKNVILTAKWKKTGIYVVDLNNFLAQQSDESKVYDVRILDLKPDVDVIISALEAHPNIKVNLDLEECTELTEVKIEPNTIPGQTTNTTPGSEGGQDIVTTPKDLKKSGHYSISKSQEGDTGTGIGEGGYTNGSGGGDRGNDVFLPNLVSITLPNGVIFICLSCDGLTSLNIPNSVKEIYIYMENPPVIRNINTINSNCTIYVPASEVDTYKNADGWSKYANQIAELDPNDNSADTIYNDNSVDNGPIDDTETDF